MDHTVEHPLNVHLDPPSQGKTIQALLGAKVPKDRFYNGQAPPINRSGCGCIDFHDHLLGERLFGFPDQDGQMFSSGLRGVQTLLPEWTALAIRRVRLIPAKEIVPDLVPPGFELEHFPSGATVTILFPLMGEIGRSKLFVCRRVMAALCRKPGIPAAKVRIRDIGVELLLSTGLEIFFAVVIAVSTQDLARKISAPTA